MTTIAIYRHGPFIPGTEIFAHASLAYQLSEDGKLEIVKQREDEHVTITAAHVQAACTLVKWRPIAERLEELRIERDGWRERALKAEAYLLKPSQCSQMKL